VQGLSHECRGSVYGSGKDMDIRVILEFQQGFMKRSSTTMEAPVATVPAGRSGLSVPVSIPGW